jgi:predicted phosphodiesterase
MRYAIISDIHSNLHALQAALSEIDKLKVDAICCLGDVVGYNAFPSECINLIRNCEKIKYCICGNHDYCVFRGLDYTWAMGFNTEAFKGIEYTINKLEGKDEDKIWLGGLPVEKVVDDPKAPFLMVHGHPLDCDEYILDHKSAASAVRNLKDERKLHFGFYGHTHIPSFISRNKDGNVKFYTQKLILKSRFSVVKEDIIELDFSNASGRSYFMMNPGPIGQQRKGGVVGFGIFDTNKLTFQYRTFRYDIKAARQAVLDAGYSDKIANKLIEAIKGSAWI